MMFYSIFYCNDTATTEIYTYVHTLSLHDALPICLVGAHRGVEQGEGASDPRRQQHGGQEAGKHQRSGPFADVSRLPRSEEHTSELQSQMRRSYAVFCLKNKHDIKQRSTYRVI